MSRCDSSTGVLSTPLDPPPRPTTIYGREDDIQKAVAIIESDKHLIIHGLGGIGKSALARSIQSVVTIQTRFNRIEFIPCHTCNGADALMQQLLRLLRRPLNRGENRISAIRQELSRESTLLMLDNFETPWSQDQEQVRTLLEHLADTLRFKLVITTRTSSACSQLRPVGKFQGYHLKSIDFKASRELFLSVAPMHSDDEVMDDLLGLLDGYPLVISLMATRAANERSIKSVLTLWKKEAESYIDDLSTNDKDQSLRISLNLSLSNPIIEAAPHALALLVFLAHFPHGLLLDTLRKLDVPLSRAERALLDTSLAELVPGNPGPSDARLPFTLDENIHGYDRIRLLIPVATFVRLNCREHRGWNEASFAEILTSANHHHLVRLETVFQTQVMPGRHYFPLATLLADFFVVTQLHFIRLPRSFSALDGFARGIRSLVLGIQNLLVYPRKDIEDFFRQVSLHCY